MLHSLSAPQLISLLMTTEVYQVSLQTPQMMSATFANACSHTRRQHFSLLRYFQGLELKREAFLSSVNISEEAGKAT